MFRVLLDDLHALACDLDFPILLPGFRKEFAQGGEPRFRGLDHLADQVFCQGHIIPSDGQQRQQILRINRAKKIEIRSVLKKLRRKARVRAE